jgi:hypothetical protein
VQGQSLKGEDVGGGRVRDPVYGEGEGDGGGYDVDLLPHKDLEWARKSFRLHQSAIAYQVNTCTNVHTHKLNVSEQQWKRGNSRKREVSV